MDGPYILSMFGFLACRQYRRSPFPKPIIIQISECSFNNSDLTFETDVTTAWNATIYFKSSILQLRSGFAASQLQNRIFKKSFTHPPPARAELLSFSLITTDFT